MRRKLLRSSHVLDQSRLWGAPSASRSEGAAAKNGADVRKRFREEAIFRGAVGLAGKRGLYLNQQREKLRARQVGQFSLRKYSHLGLHQF